MTTLFSAGCNQISDKDFSAKYYWGSHLKEYSMDLINSKQEFDALLSEAGINQGEFVDIYDDFAAYDDKFFACTSLLMLFLPIGSGSIKLEVNSLEYGADSVTVKIDKFSPQMQTCDMSYWLIVVNPNKKLPSGTKVNLKFDNALKAPPDFRRKHG